MFKTDAQALRAISDEQEATYKRRNKGLNNKMDDVYKKVTDLIDKKNGIPYASRPVKNTASAPNSRSSSPKYYQTEWLRPKNLQLMKVSKRTSTGTWRRARSG